jgi:hypothetical protein
MREGRPYTTLYLDGDVPVTLVFANEIESQDYIKDMAGIKAGTAFFWGRFPEARTTQEFSVVAVKVANEWLDFVGRMETKWVRLGLVPSVVAARKEFITGLIVA